MSRRALLMQGDVGMARAPTSPSVAAELNDCRFEVIWARTSSKAPNPLESSALESSPPSTAAMAAMLFDLALPDSQDFATFDQLYRCAPSLPMLILCTASKEPIA